MYTEVLPRCPHELTLWTPPGKGSLPPNSKKLLSKLHQARGQQTFMSVSNFHALVEPFNSSRVGEGRSLDMMALKHGTLTVMTYGVHKH